VLEHPDLVEQLHRNFVHCGSDVVEAFTYYAHREKLRMIGREKDLARINRQALRIAKKVARGTGALFAGDVCNTNVFEPDSAASAKAVRAMFEEQVDWAAEAGVDFIVGETFAWTQEALIALDVIRKRAKVPAVITLAMHREDVTREGWTVAEAAKRLEGAGADVVGLNCIRGPRTMMPLLRQIRSAVRCHVAALPVPFRTTPEQPSFQSLVDPCCAAHHPRAFPTGLDPFLCTRFEIADFAREALSLGIKYLGVCCGAGPHHIRAMAEALGRAPPASRFSPDMTKHAFLGSDPRVARVQRDYAAKL
jgi:betaine-homocysteine S-methyltransferase